MPCLKCGGPSEEDSLLCDACADACAKDARFFLDPVLVGPSVFTQMRAEGSLATMLGPTPGSGYVRLQSTDLQRHVLGTSLQSLPAGDLRGFHELCNSLLAHLGVTLNLDQPAMLLTEEAAETITSIVQRVETAEQMHPLEGSSDLYIRVGVVYWSSSRGIILRVTSKGWRDARRGQMLAKAKDFFSKVSQKDDLYSIAVRDLGMLCIDSQEWKDAERYLTDALRHFPSDPRIGEALARVHLELGNQMDALGMVDEALVQGETPSLWVLKGRVLRDMGRNEDALECFDKALTLDFNTQDAHDEVIATLRDIGRVEDAALAERQRAFSRTPDLDKKVADLIEDLRKGTAQSAPAAIPAAHPHAEHRVKSEPPKAKPAQELAPLDAARAALAAKDYDSAAQSLEEVLRADPNDRQAELMLLEAFVGLGDMDQASARAHSFYERNRNDPLAWHWRGVVSAKENKWGAAVQYLSKAVTIDPKLIESWLLMGETLFVNKKYSGADEAFSRALQIDGENPHAWLGKAKTMRELGRWGASIQCLDKYNLIEPDDASGWLLKADLLFEKEKHRRAVEAYDKYLSLAQADSHALGRKGAALNSLGMADEARAALEEAVRLDSDNRDAVRLLRSMKGAGEG